MRISLIFTLLFCSCSYRSDRKYVIVESHATTVVDEMDDKDRAFRKANDLNALGGNMPHRPRYFVLEATR